MVVKFVVLLNCISLVAVSKTKQAPKKELGVVIGIDLGTTYSCVGIYKNCHVEIIENDQGSRITPSIVGFTPDGERLIGDAAKNLLTTNPRSMSIEILLIIYVYFLPFLDTIFQIKRLIGRRFDEQVVKNDIKSFPFKVIEKNGRPVVEVYTGLRDKLFAPEEISAMVLSKMRQLAVILQSTFV